MVFLLYFGESQFFVFADSTVALQKYLFRKVFPFLTCLSLEFQCVLWIISDTIVCFSVRESLMLEMSVSF